MGDITEQDLNQESSTQEQSAQTLPKSSASRDMINRIIARLKREEPEKSDKEVLENLTGGPTIPVEDLAEKGKSPISPLDDFLKPKK